MPIGLLTIRRTLGIFPDCESLRRSSRLNSLLAMLRSTKDYSLGIGGRPKTFWQGMKEVSMFFQGRDEVHKTMRRLAKRLEKADIPYVVVGGMAVFAHH